MALPSGPPAPQRPKILSTGVSEVAVDMVVSTTVLSVLAILLALIRFYARGRANLGADDYVLMFVVILLNNLDGGGISAYVCPHDESDKLPYRSLPLTDCKVAFVGGQGWGVQDLALHPEKKAPLPKVCPLLQVNGQYQQYLAAKVLDDSHLHPPRGSA